MINGARYAIQLAKVHAMYRWGLREGFTYGVLVGVIVGASIPIIVFLLIARYST